MELKRFRPIDVRNAMKKNNVPGNWSGYQNVYNMISGICAPKDPYTYVVLANLLDESVETIILRYSRATGFKNDVFDSPASMTPVKEVDWDDSF